MTLQLVAGASVTGTFLHIGFDSAETYAARYEQWRSARDPGNELPMLGSHVRLERPRGGRVEGRFAGFEGDAVVVADAIGPERSISLDELSAPWGPGRGIQGSAFRDELARAPRRDVLTLRTTAGERTMPLDEIHWIFVPERATGRQIGTLLGATCDAISFALLISVGRP